MELTRSGVCYNLNESPFYTEWNGITFYFSSETHKRKFDRYIKIKTDWLSDSLSRRFHFNIEASYIAIFQLYNLTETRGFHVKMVNGESVYSINDIYIEAVLVNG